MADVVMLRDQENNRSILIGQVRRAGDSGPVWVGNYTLDRRELEAALIVATGQRCDSLDGALRDERYDTWPERLLAERYPPPEQWEECPTTHVLTGDTLRHPVFDEHHARITLTLEAAEALRLFGSDTVERLVKP